MSIHLAHTTLFTKCRRAITIHHLVWNKNCERINTLEDEEDEGKGKIL